MEHIEKADTFEEKQKAIRLLLEYQKKKQDQIALIQRESLGIRHTGKEYQLSYIKQLLGIISGLSLLVFGPFVFVQYDPPFGTLLTSAGLANLGYNAGILRLFQRKSNSENHNE